MNHVTFETAVRLKESGFPQPEPEFGQVWYSETLTVMISCGCYLGEGYEDRYFVTDKFGEVHFVERDTIVFAPTATDILQQIGNDYYLNSVIGTHWYCESKFSPIIAYQSNNPAKACALAWLAIHEKKQE